MKITFLFLFLFAFLHLPAQNQPRQEERIETVVQAGHYASVTALCISPDGKLLFTGSGDKNIKAWELATGREIRSYISSAGTVMRLSISPDGKTLASVGRDYRLRLWDVETSLLKRTISLEGDEILDVCFSPDGNTLITGTEKNHAIAWDPESGDETGRFVPSRRDINMQKDFGYPSANTVQFSPDGRQLLTGSNDRTAILFDVASGKEVRIFKADRSSCTSCQISAAFSPDGKLVAIGSMVDNNFYFIPTEGVSLYQPDKLVHESINAWQIQEKFRQIRALKQLVVLDACQSGGSSQILAQRGAMEEKEWSLRICDR